MDSAQAVHRGVFQQYRPFSDIAPSQSQQPDLAESGMAAFATAVAESCHWLGLDAAKRYRSVPIVQVRPERARNNHRIPVERQPTARPGEGLEKTTCWDDSQVW